MFGKIYIMAWILIASLNDLIDLKEHDQLKDNSLFYSIEKILPDAHEHSDKTEFRNYILRLIPDPGTKLISKSAMELIGWYKEK